MADRYPPAWASVCIAARPVAAKAYSALASKYFLPISTSNFFLFIIFIASASSFMAKAAKQSKRASLAAAQESRIEFNGHSLGEPADGVSGNPGGIEEDSAGMPGNSADGSGEVSSETQTPAKSSSKKASRLSAVPVWGNKADFGIIYGLSRTA